MLTNTKLLIRSLIPAALLGFLFVACDIIVTRSEEPEVKFMIASEPGSMEAAEIQKQIEKFTQKTGIDVELMLVPFTKFNDELLAMCRDNKLPDVAALSRNHIVDFTQRLNCPIEPLDNRISTINVEDFLDEAISNIIIKGDTLALPFRRSARLPHFEYVAQFSASQNPDAAFALMDFLTQPDTQIENFNELRWYPTRKSVYDSLKLIREPSRTFIPLQPQEIIRAIAIVVERAGNLANVLEGKTLNPYEATAFFAKSASNGPFSFLDSQDPELTAAPVVEPVEEDELEAALNGDGLIIGAWLVNTPLEVDEPMPIRIEPGDYVVKLIRDPVDIMMVKGVLIPSNASTPDTVSLASYELLAAPIGQPVSSFEELLAVTNELTRQVFNSTKLIKYDKCFYFYRRCGCIRIRFLEE